MYHGIGKQIGMQRKRGVWITLVSDYVNSFLHHLESFLFDVIFFLINYNWNQKKSKHVNAF